MATTLLFKRAFSSRVLSRAACSGLRLLVILRSRKAYAALARKARAYYALFAMENSRQLLVAGHSEAAWKQIREAFCLSQNWSVFWQFLSFLILRTRIAGAWLKRRFFAERLKFKIFNS